MHYYKRNIGDYAKKAGKLSMLQHGAYTLLIDACYDRERFPTLDDAIEWAWADTPEQVAAVEFVLRKFFRLQDGVYVQDRITEELAAYKALSEVNSRIAKDREAQKKAQKSTKREPVVNEPAPNHKPLTINQEPLTNDSVAKATGAKAPLTPDEIIFGYGVPLLTNAGTPDKQARSFLGGLRKSHGDDALVNALRDCVKAKPLQPLEWLAKALPPLGAAPKRNKQEMLEDRNRSVVERMLQKESSYEPE